MSTLDFNPVYVSIMVLGILLNMSQPWTLVSQCSLNLKQVQSVFFFCVLHGMCQNNSTHYIRPYVLPFMHPVNTIQLWDPFLTGSSPEWLSAQNNHVQSYRSQQQQTYPVSSLCPGVLSQCGWLCETQSRGGFPSGEVGGSGDWRGIVNPESHVSVWKCDCERPVVSGTEA